MGRGGGRGGRERWGGRAGEGKGEEMGGGGGGLLKRNKEDWVKRLERNIEVRELGKK